MFRKKASQLRHQIRRTEHARQRQVDRLLRAEEMVVGSFVTLGRKCGKPSCRCASGELHYSKFLSRSEEGRTRLIYVRSADEVDVAQKAEQYRRFRKARAELMKLATQTAELADQLHAELTVPYPPPNRAPGYRRRRKSRGGRNS
jgi:hypothetical protein